MSDELKNCIQAFASQKWIDRREHARKAADLLNQHIEMGFQTQMQLWEGICSDNEDIRYWSKRVLEKTASLDFFIALLENNEVIRNTSKSRDLFELLSYRFTEMYPYLLSNFSYFNRDNQLNLIRLLARNGDSNLLDFFTSLSRSDDTDFKDEAISFLSRFHTRDALEGLFAFLCDESFRVKARSATVLTKSFEFLDLEGDQEYMGWFLPVISQSLKDRYLLAVSAQDIDRVVTILEETDTARRFVLMRLLPKEEKLVRVFLSHPLAEIQFLSLLCFKDCIAERFSDDLNRFLDSEFMEIRDTALMISREANLEIAPEKLYSLIQTDNLEGRKIVLDLIALYPDENLYVPVKNLAGSEKPETRFFALYPLAQFYRFEKFREEILSILTESFNDTYWPVRNQASLCFKYLGDDAGLALLKNLDSGHDVDIVYWSIITLGQFKDESINTALLEFFNDSLDYSLRKAIIEVSGNFPGEKTADFFRQHINDRDLRASVLKSMHHLSNEQIEDIIRIGDIDENELPPWIRMRRNPNGEKDSE